jgi:hypothetical protein
MITVDSILARTRAAYRVARRADVLAFIERPRHMLGLFPVRTMPELPPIDRLIEGLHWLRDVERDHIKCGSRYADINRTIAFEAALIAARYMRRQAMPRCPYCGETKGLRTVCDGGGYIAPEYSCAECFKAQDTGPCFDDLE